MRNIQKFPYLWKGKTYNYIPDFKMKDGTFVEVKGWLNEKEKAKIAGFKEKLTVVGKKEIKFYIEYVVKKYGGKYTELYDSKKDEKIIKCFNCDKVISRFSRSGKCVSCVRLNKQEKKLPNPNWRTDPKPNRRKVERPSKEELEKLIKENSWISLGKRFGVSDNAVRKWAKKYGLPLK